MDFKVNGAMALGPFLSFSVAEFTTQNTTVVAGGTTQTQSGSISDKALHEWLTIGIKGTLGI